jgi:putative Mn2+ efflux pump MntP
MKFFKLLLLLFALVFVVWGAFWLFGVVAGLLYALVKWAVIIGVVALAGVGVYKLVSGPDEEEAQAALSPAEAEMLKAERLLADLRRKELTK